MKAIDGIGNDERSSKKEILLQLMTENENQ
jgi:hypothetical protein